MSAACCGRRGCCRRGPSTPRAGISADDLRAVEDDADPRGRGDAARRRPAQRHRRRVPAGVVAHGLHLPARRRLPGRGRAHPREVPRRGGRVRLRAAGDARRRHGADRAHDLRRRVRVPARHGGRRNAEADDPLAEHGALPRRQLRDRPRRVPRARRRSGPISPRPTPTRWPPRRARLHVSPARRHQPRLRERPRPARAHRLDRRRPRAPARDATSRTSTGRSARPAGRPQRDDTHVPRERPVDVGCRGRLRLRRRGALLGARGGRVLPGVRRCPLRRLRAAAVRPAGQVRGARPGHHEAAAARGKGRAQAPDRGGGPLSSTSTSCASRRSAGSRRPSRATGSRSPSR